MDAIFGLYAELVLDYFNRNSEHLRDFDQLRSEKFYKVENRKKAIEQELIEINNVEQLGLWIFKKSDLGFQK